MESSSRNLEEVVESICKKDPYYNSPSRKQGLCGELLARWYYEDIGYIVQDTAEFDKFNPTDLIVRYRDHSFNIQVKTICKFISGFGGPNMPSGYWEINANKTGTTQKNWKLNDFCFLVNIPSKVPEANDHDTGKIFLFNIAEAFTEYKNGGIIIPCEKNKGCIGTDDEFEWVYVESRKHLKEIRSLTQDELSYIVKINKDVVYGKSFEHVEA